MDSIKEVSRTEPEEGGYAAHLADCIVITKDGKLLLQHRPGKLSFFGGHIEPGETIVRGLIRELKEELGADAGEHQIVHVASITEDFTNHTEIVHIHIWRDMHGTVTGCYEFDAVEFDTVEAALAHPDIMDYAAWGLREAGLRGASVEALKRHLF